MNEPVYGVAPGATYDPDIDLLYEDDDEDTVKRAAIDSTVKLRRVEVAV